MKIAVLGPGCTNCKTTYEIVLDALGQTGVEAELIKVESIQEIISYKVMLTPAVVIDGEIKCSGRIPKIEEVKGWIKK